MQNSTRHKETENNLTNNVQMVRSTCDAMSHMMSPVQSIKMKGTIIESMAGNRFLIFEKHLD